MKKKLLLSIFLLTLVLFSFSNFAFSKPEKPIIVATTTVLSSVVKDLIGDKVNVITLVPPGSCPAHFDLKPSDVEALKEARLVLAHGFEPWIEKMSVKVVKVGGGWNNAELAKKLYMKVANILKASLPQYAEQVEKSLSNVLKELDSLDKLVARERKSMRDIKAIVMKWQVPFVKWVGISIIATYPPPETVSASQVERIIAVGKVKKAMLVIDNLQSGISLGRKLSAEMGAVHVVLTNFPGSLPKTENIASMIKYNLNQVLNGVKAYRRQVRKIARLQAEISDLSGRLKFWKAVSAAALGIVIIESFMLLRRR